MNRNQPIVLFEKYIFDDHVPPSISFVPLSILDLGHDETFET